MKGTGYNQYERWKRIWRPLIPANGDITKVYQKKAELASHLDSYIQEHRSLLYTSDWRELGPTITPLNSNMIGGIGRLSTCEIDKESPNYIFAGSPVGGLFYSDDYGANFHSTATDFIRYPNGVSSIAISTVNATKYWFVGTGDKEDDFSVAGGIYRSTNLGKDWVLISNGFPLPEIWTPYKITKILANPGNPNQMFVSTTSSTNNANSGSFTYGIYKTDNALSEHPSWTLIKPGHYFDMAFKPIPESNGNYKLYIAGDVADFSLYNSSQFPLLSYTLDNGNSWTDVSIQPLLPTPSTFGLRVNIETTPAAPNYVYVSVKFGYDQGTGNFGKYDGQTVSYLSSVSFVDTGKEGFAVSPTNAQIMYFGDVKIFGSNDGGLTWIDCHANCHDDIHEIVFTPDGSKIWVANDGGIIRKDSYPINSSWSDFSHNIGCSLAEFTAHSKANPNDYLFAGWDVGTNLLRKDLTGSNKWKHIGDGDGSFVSFDPNQIGTFYHNENGNLTKYVNYQRTNNFYWGASYSFHSRGLFTNPISSSWIYNTDKNGFFVSNNQGYPVTSWHQSLISPSDEPYYSWSCWQSPTNEHVLYLRLVKSLGDKIIFTQDIETTGPAQWTLVDVPDVMDNSGRFVSSIAVDDENPYKIWVTIPGYWGLSNGTNPKIWKGEYNISNNTWQWTNVTHSLESLNPSVGSIVHVSGSDDALYIGTDAGVFYIDNSLNDWVPFNNGLPNKGISDLHIEYNSGVATKLSVGIYGRGIWETNLDCIYSTTPLVITTTPPAAWVTPQTIQSDLIIKQGATLTINCKISFSASSKIIVEAGGKLILDGGTLTSACNSLWRGVEVWGTKNQSQLYPQYQGTVELINNGTISNAECAIRLVKLDNRGIPVSDFTGGIVKCTRATFLNNKTAVKFYPYQNFNPLNNKEISNASYFTNVMFTTTDAYLNMQSKPDFFVELNKVKTIPFNGCSFTNSIPTLIPACDRGTGIYSFASGFKVDRVCANNNTNPCSSWISSNFSGLYYGIRAMGDGGAYYVNIDHTTFDKNLRGVYIGGIDLVCINRNSFFTKIGTSQTPSSGVYLDYCSGYSVQENSFSGNYTGIFPFINTYETGIVINNSGEAVNSIYNNRYIQSLQYGIIAQNKNRNSSGSTGLTIKCNDFQSPNMYDIAVTKSDVNATLMGINTLQGANGISTTDPAGNTFSYSWQAKPSLIESDYMNQCENLSYIYHAQSNGFNVQPIRFTASPKVSPSQTTINNISYSKNLSCPSQLGNGVSSTDMRSDKLIAESKIDYSSNQLAILNDGGNTEQLLTEVQTSIAPDALALHNELIDKSPYLSDIVMIEAMNKEDVLPAAMVTEVLVANPQAAKADAVTEALDGRENPLSEDQRSDIDQGVFILGAKESLESELAQSYTERANAQYELMRYFLSDTTQISTDSVNDALIAEPDLWAKYLLSMQQVLDGDTLSADATLQSIASSNSLSTREQLQLAAYIDYANVQKQLVNAGNLIPDSLQELSLKAIASDTLYQPSAYARAILVNAGKIEYNEPYVFPVDGLKSGKVIVKKQKSYTDENTLKIYPNPAKDFIIAEYTLKEGVLNASLKIVDVSGKQLKTIAIKGKHDYLVIPTNDLAPGIFFCRLFTKVKVVSSVKFSITK